jgi:hypothetical protein
MWNNAATSWNCWLQGGLPVAISITVQPTLLACHFMTHLTNDLWSHPVVGGANSEMVASLTTFLDAPKSASLIHPLLSTRMFALLIDVRVTICNPCGQFVAFISKLGDNKPKMLKVGPKFFQR